MTHRQYKNLFKDFLKEHDAFHQFKQCNKQHVADLVLLFSSKPPANWVLSAFEWGATGEFNFWSDLNTKWHQLLLVIKITNSQPK